MPVNCHPQNWLDGTLWLFLKTVKCSGGAENGRNEVITTELTHDKRNYDKPKQ